MRSNSIKLPKFKIRCSAGGQIMTEPRAKSPMQNYLDESTRIEKAAAKWGAMRDKNTKTAVELEGNINRWEQALDKLKKHKDDVLLSQTCMTYLKTWAKEQLYDRRKEITSKFLTKGILQEDLGVDMIKDHLELGMLIVNEEEFNNDFMTGTPDLILPDMIIDDKNSWDIFTFPLFETEIPDKDYYWQLQGYMKLMDKPKAKLIYTLTDMPRHLIESEAQRYCYQFGHEFTENIFSRFEKLYTYPDIPADLKIKVFDIDRNDSDIEAMEQRVKDCREYIKTLKS